MEASDDECPAAAAAAAAAAAGMVFVTGPASVTDVWLIVDDWGTASGTDLDADPEGAAWLLAGDSVDIVSEDCAVGVPASYPDRAAAEAARYDMAYDRWSSLAGTDAASSNPQHEVVQPVV